jgi:hypothetical protein
VYDLACSSDAVKAETVRELQRRKGKFQQQAVTLQGASRQPVLSDMHVKDMELLEKLTKVTSAVDDSEIQVTDGTQVTQSRKSPPFICAEADSRFIRSRRD